MGCSHFEEAVSCLNSTINIDICVFSQILINPSGKSLHFDLHLIALPVIILTGISVYMLDTQQENDRESLGYLLGISKLYFLRASVQYEFICKIFKSTSQRGLSGKRLGQPAICPQFSVSHHNYNNNNSNHELPPPLPLPLYSF